MECYSSAQNGDPPSPLFFTELLDEVVAGPLPKFGITVIGCQADHLAYADYFVIFAENEDRSKERYSYSDGSCRYGDRFMELDRAKAAKG